MKFANRVRRCVVAAAIVLMYAKCASAETLTWGATSDLANGVLGIDGLTLGTSASRTYVNPGNEGFDVQVRFYGSTTAGGASNFNGGYSGNNAVLGGGNYIFFQSNPSTAQAFAWIDFSFYKTGTLIPVDVLGFKTRIEDVERGTSNTASDSSTGQREYLIGPKVTSDGVTQQLNFNNTSIFDLPNGTLGRQIDSKNITFNASPETVSRAVPGYQALGGTQANKYVGIDLSTTGISYFRIGQSRLNTNSGSVLMGSLGDITLESPAAVPLPGVALGGFSLMGATALRKFKRSRAV